MTMIDVESSNIKAVGYDPDIYVLAVRYHDGALYIRPGCPPDTYARLMAAPSKGQFVAALPGSALLVEQRPAEAPAPTAPPIAPTGPLDTYDPDECCGKLLAAAMRRGDLRKAVAWTCHKCGELWCPEVIAGGVRHWRIKPIFVTNRPRPRPL